VILRTLSVLLHLHLLAGCVVPPLCQVEQPSLREQLDFSLPPHNMATDPEVSASPEASANGAPQTPEIDEAVLKTHPSFKALEEAKNAAVQELKTMKGRLKSVTAEKTDEKVEPQSKASLDEEEVDFRIQHSDELKVFGPTYKELRAKGYERPHALALAKLEHQKTNPQSVEVQAANSGATPVADRTGGDEPELTAFERQLGISPKTKAQWRDVVEGQ